MSPVPTPPYKVSLYNLYPGSDHPDVATFQAAIVRNLKVTNLPITGVYDTQTQVTVKNLSLKAKKIRTDIKLKDGVWTIPNENFVRLIGLVLR